MSLFNVHQATPAAPITSTPPIKIRAIKLLLEEAAEVLLEAIGSSASVGCAEAADGVGPVLSAGGATVGARDGGGFGASGAGVDTAGVDTIGAAACVVAANKLQPHLPQNFADGLLAVAHCGHTFDSISGEGMLATAGDNFSPHDLQNIALSGFSAPQW